MSISRLVTVIITQIFLYTVCFGQGENIDSLKRLLPSLHNSARVDCLNALSELYIGLPSWFNPAPTRSNLDTAEIFNGQAGEEAKKSNYIFGMARASALKAEMAFENSNYPQAEILSREAISLYRQTPNKKGLNRTYWRFGTTLHSQSLFDAAVSNYDTSYNLSKNSGDTLFVWYSVVTAANVLNEKGDYKNAFERMLILHKLNTNSSNPLWKAWELQILGNMYFAFEDHSSALKYAQQASDLVGPDYTQLTLLFALNKQFDSAQKYFNLATFDTSNRRALRGSLGFFGQYYLLLNDYDKALPYLLKYLNYNKQDNDVNWVMDGQTNVAKTYLGLQILDSAFKYAHEALTTAGLTDAKQFKRDACKILSSIFDHWHRPDSAYSYYKQYTVINDSILNDQLKGKLAGYTFEQQIELLNKEKEIQQIQLQKQSFQKNILIAGIVVFLFIAFLLWRNNRHKQKANTLLQQQKEKVESTLSQLKSTQAQLVQSEKMASLGELTAGIAHEIQNPLNFVNNFSEVNKEMLEELKAERLRPNIERDDQLESKIINDVIANEEKINYHGKRADVIVKGMLQHSRATSGQKEPTDINSLCDEYIRLAFHGLRAKDKSFHAKSETDFDQSIGKINVEPRDIGRVILNLINNAFYAINEKVKQKLNGYEPTVQVSTKKAGEKVLIVVKDNGNGIPQKVLDKIFQPFFTTKPAGQGTGLGLSLAYDIVKAHGGKIKVETREGEGSEFIIQLPII